MRYPWWRMGVWSFSDLSLTSRNLCFESLRLQRGSRRYWSQAGRARAEPTAVGRRCLEGLNAAKTVSCTWDWARLEETWVEGKGSCSEGNETVVRRFEILLKVARDSISRTERFRHNIVERVCIRYNSLMQVQAAEYRDLFNSLLTDAQVRRI